MKKNYSFLSAIAAVAMALCVSFGFQSCGNLDNPLEEIVNNGGGDDEAVSKLMEALKADANIKVKYTVYGDETEYIATFKNVGSGEDSQYEIEGEIPEGLNYGLSYTLEYKELEGEDFLIFTLLAQQGVQQQQLEAGTRTAAPVAHPVLVVDFDINDMEYDVYALPGFSFEVLSINNEDIKEIKDGFSKKATVNFKKQGYGDPTDMLVPMYIGYDAGDTWEDVQLRYELAGFENVIASHQIDPEEEAEVVFVRLWIYQFIYGNPQAEGNYFNFQLEDKDGDTCFNDESLENGPFNAIADARDTFIIMLRDINNEGLNMGMQFVLPNQDENTWDDIVDENSYSLTDKGNDGIQHILRSEEGIPNRIFYLYRDISGTGSVLQLTTGDNANYNFNATYFLQENSQVFGIHETENTVKLAIPMPTGNALTWGDILAVNSGDEFGNRISKDGDDHIIYTSGETTYYLCKVVDNMQYIPATITDNLSEENKFVPTANFQQ